MAKTKEKPVDEAVTDAGAEKRKTAMTGGPAIDWIASNRGNELRRADGDRVRMLPGDEARVERYDSNTGEWKPMQLIDMLWQEFEVA